MANSETTEKATDTDSSIPVAECVSTSSTGEQDKKSTETRSRSGKSLRKSKGPPKEVIATKVTGIVKLFNIRSGYGFISRYDTKEDVFMHHSSILKINPRRVIRAAGDGEQVEFDVVKGEKGNEAANVTGLNGAPLKGSSFIAERRWISRTYKGSSGRTGNKENEEGQEHEEGGEGRGSGRGGSRVRRGNRFVPHYSRGRGGSRSGQRSKSQDDGDKAQLDDNETKEVEEGGDSGENRGRGGRGRGGRRGRPWFHRRGRGGERGSHQNGGEGDVAPTEIIVQ